MIWHIFQERRAYCCGRWAALVAALRVCAAIPQYLIESRQGGPSSSLFSVILLSVLALLGVAVVVVVTMHQDPIPGARQDG